MIDNISGLLGWRLRIEPDGSIAMLLRQKYSDIAYLMDTAQAEKLAESLLEFIHTAASLPNRQGGTQ